MTPHLTPYVELGASHRLKKALEEFDLVFPSGLFRLSHLESVRLVLVRQMKLDRFITQAKRDAGPSSSGS